MRANPTSPAHVFFAALLVASAASGFAQPIIEDDGITILPPGQPPIVPRVIYNNGISDIDTLVLGSRPEYQCVGSLYEYNTYYPEAGRRFVCSGVLIAPQLVISALHCGYTTPCGGNAANFGGWPANSAAYPHSQWFQNYNMPAARAIDEWIPYPEGSWNCSLPVGDGRDLELFLLEGRGEVNLQPASLYRGSDETGSVATLVGCGGYGTAATWLSNNTYTYPDGKIRAVQNILDVSNPGMFPPVNGSSRTQSAADVIYQDGFSDRLDSGPWPVPECLLMDLDDAAHPQYSVYGGVTPLAMEGCGAPGDSGGGVFLGSGASSSLCAINSFQYRPDACASGCQLFGVSRLSPYLQWIDDYRSVARWQPNCGSTSSSYNDPKNWWTGGQRAVPASTDSIVVTAPILAYSASLIPFTSTISETLTRTPVTMQFSQDAIANRLRLRYGVDLTLALQGHTLELASTSTATTALSAALAAGEWPILRVVGGTVRAFDASFGEQSHLQSSTYLFTSAEGVVSGQGSRMELLDALYLGDRKAPFAQGALTHRPSAGKGTLSVGDGGRVLVGRLLRMGRCSDPTTRVFIRDNLTEYSGSIIDELCGVVNLNGGSVTVGSGPEETSPSTLRIHPAGVFESTGRVAGNVVNSGGIVRVIDFFVSNVIGDTFNPSGWYFNKRGRIDIAGTFAQQPPGALEVDLGGTTARDGYDVLAATGAVSLGGTLRVSLVLGHVPVIGNTYSVVQGASVTGTFSTVILPPLPVAQTWRVNYNPASVVLAVIANPCPADFNVSGTLSVQDIFDFLAGYFANDPRADFNAAGGISVQDIFDFLAAYFAGCA